MSVKISKLVSCYHKEKNIPLFMAEIAKASAQIPTAEFEIIFVDDGSKDKTLLRSFS